MLASEAEWKSQSFKIKSALSDGSFVLKEQFLWDSIAAKRKLDETQYQFDPVCCVLVAVSHIIQIAEEPKPTIMPLRSSSSGISTSTSSAPPPMTYMQRRASCMLIQFCNAFLMSR